MTNSEIRNLLNKLRNQIQGSQLDAETRSLMQDLDSDIHKLLGSEETEVETTSVLNRAREFEAEFESDHPTTVRILREVIDALSRMGI
ncbi:MAG: DUF4404 family protein [Gammaproteobacteria bacterium]|nr:DUF4404 family protein [Gammaproteobacteria bacterium]